MLVNTSIGWGRKVKQQGFIGRILVRDFVSKPKQTNQKKQDKTKKTKTKTRVDGERWLSR